jgi:TatD DNase family protein
MLIDTHAHVNFKDFKEDGEKIIKQTLSEDIWIINVGSEIKTSQRAVEYACKYSEGVYAAVGLHPIHVYKGATEKDWDGKEIDRTYEELDIAKYKKLAENDKVVAIGEIGLDYKDDTSQKIKEKQQEVFCVQLELAQHIEKPVIFHCRKAYNELIDILEAFNSGCAVCPMACPGAGGSKLRGVFHCFMGRQSQAAKLLEMDFYFGFNGLITYARDYDKVIEFLPLNRILLETDCPYLTPEPLRGQRNEPLNVRLVAQKISEIKKISLEEVAKQTTQNAKNLFRI